MEWLKSFCNSHAFPEEAVAALLNAYQTLEGQPAACSLFVDTLEQYYNVSSGKGPQVGRQLAKVAEITGLHSYTVDLLYYICLAEQLQEKYMQHGLSESLFFNTMEDLKYKLMECHQVYGVWGTFVSPWYAGFYDMARFQLGRLQFELIPFDGTYSGPGGDLQPTDTVINMHIPSCGPLTQESCLESYQMAAEFFADAFCNRPFAFFCYSWLLYPPHKVFLPPHSNILKFMEPFDIFDYRDGSTEDLWRIFGRMDCSDLSALPTDTSLQRAYIGWLSAGNTAGSGRGVFFYRDGHIL